MVRGACVMRRCVRGERTRPDAVRRCSLQPIGDAAEGLSRLVGSVFVRNLL